MKNKKINLMVLVIAITAFACMGGVAEAVTCLPDGIGDNNALSSGPYYHQIYSATSTDGINWTVDDTLLFDHASVPGAIYFENKLYLYYVNAEDPEHEKLSVGISKDRGMTFTVYDVHISGSNSPHPVDPNPIIDGGQIRLTYLGNFNQGETNKIVTALSSDGINFTEDGVIFTGYVYDPDLFYDEVGGEWVLLLNTGGLTKATASSPTTTFTEDTGFNWSEGSISSTHKIGGKYYTYYAGMGVSVAEYSNGSLTNIADGILGFQGLNADPTVAIFGENDYKMFFKTMVEEGGGEEGDWIKESGIRLGDGSVPYVLRLDNGMYRMYYNNPDGIFSAISEDGINFTKEPGVRLTGTNIPGDPEWQAHGATVIELDDGFYRMYYIGATGEGGPGHAIHRIYSAISPDGLNFTREGIRIESEGTIDNGWASVPEIVRTFDGRYHLYYCSIGAESIASAISDDGLNFTREYGPGLGNGTGVYGADPAVCKLPDGTYWMFFTSPGGPMPPWNLKEGIYSARSTDGVNFTKDAGVRVSPGGVYDSVNTYDPTVISLSDGRFRIYYGGASEEGVVTLSAVSPPIIFDTGNGTYPSISGTHNGTITPSYNVNVSHMYTYPCAGTGGHAEYVKIWNSTWNTTATWNGYSGDYHNLTFDEPFVLRAGETYNYTIKTGSYPQIVHATSKAVTGGTITCTEFIDANCCVYNNCIPAFRLG
ncbi:MAG: hypothetical protein PHD13_05485 [Methanocellales archaeon]|nr:hypothetical protein [Methanocellales archaeon]MDD3292348.1 hypothetical protein [Methanocellales archaeon]MDD5235606.1 hypothetical protein [Methanocellales archaeon]MDD5485747.1 hypothetical protein [Methanocellales archaeon]